MDVPAPTPPPTLPGTWTVTASPRWGHARVQDGVGHTLTILSSVQAHADAAAAIVAGHAALLAERDRLLKALHQLAGYELDDGVRHVARRAIGLEGLPC
jgi:hypothetical protein